ncbi:MAG TPA: hypothetical protein VFN85_12390 [Solirubrobacterales bacterium]|nr:hypothetical protein [Solirubrobacterales bacterium]
MAESAAEEVAAPARRGARRKDRRLLLVFGLATVVLDAVVLLIERKLGAGGRPSILDLELSGSEARVAEIASEWGADGLRLARIQLWIDFAFMVSYGTFFTLAGLATRTLARERGLRRLAAAGVVVPFFAAAAAVFDACENAIWLLILGGHAGALAPVGTACAVTKFSLIGIAIAYSACGLFLWLLSLRKAGSR